MYIDQKFSYVYRWILINYLCKSLLPTVYNMASNGKPLFFALINWFKYFSLFIILFSIFVEFYTFFNLIIYYQKKLFNKIVEFYIFVE